MNYQHWHGEKNVRYGYGRHTQGYIGNAPDNIRFDEHASVNVLMGVPWQFRGWHQGQHRVLHTMWETDTLPLRFQRYMPLFDQIVVPCQHNVALFSKHHPNVVSVPEGIDRTLFRPRKMPRRDVFTFKAAGSEWLRKGFDVVIRAFHRLGLEDTELHIKVSPEALNVPVGPYGDRVVMNKSWMTEDEHVRWLADTDCFIAASRGEGWGLIPCQTISMAVPTIVSETSGHFEFLDLATATVKCSKSLSFLGGMWDEPDVDDLVDKMRWVYENRTEARKIAKDKADGIDRFSWVSAAEALTDALPVGTLLSDPAWVPATIDLEVVALRHIKADIHRTHVRQNKGDRFMVTDGVYQVLYDSGAVRLVNQ